MTTKSMRGAVLMDLSAVISAMQITKRRLNLRKFTEQISEQLGVPMALPGKDPNQQHFIWIAWAVTPHFNPHSRNPRAAEVVKSFHRELESLGWTMEKRPLRSSFMLSAYQYRVPKYIEMRDNATGNTREVYNHLRSRLQRFSVQMAWTAASICAQKVDRLVVISDDYGFTGPLLNAADKLSTEQSDLLFFGDRIDPRFHEDQNVDRIARRMRLTDPNNWDVWDEVQSDVDDIATKNYEVAQAFEDNEESEEAETAQTT